jgi:hypothetical protein
MPSKAKSSDNVQKVVSEPVKKQEAVKKPVKETKEPVKEAKATKKEKPAVKVETVESDDDDDNSIIEITDDSDLDSDDSDLDSDDSDSDSDSDDSDDSDSDDSDEESVAVTESSKKSTSDKKEVVKEKPPKKEKPTFKQVVDELERLHLEEKKILLDLTDLNKKVRALEILKATNDRLVNKQVALLPKAHEEAVNKARKEKKKRTNSSRSGILKPHPVPPVLVSFIGLKEGTELERPKVMGLLSNKFKELGLKKGQDTILDKKTAKIFGYEEGHVIGFKEFQTFLKGIYDSAKTNEVAL